MPARLDLQDRLGDDLGLAIALPRRQLGQAASTSTCDRTDPAWISRGDSAATRSRRVVNSSYSRALARSSARRTLSSYSFSSGVMYRSAFLTVCLRMKSGGTFDPCAWVISM